MERSVELLRLGRSEQARRELALSILHAGRGAGSIPTVDLAARVAGVDDDLQVVGDLSDAIGRSAAIALSGMTVLQGSVGDEDAASSIYSEGRVHGGGVAMLDDIVEQAAGELNGVLIDLSRSPEPSLSAVQEALATARFRLASAVDAAERGSVALGVLPELAGLNGDRRYLLAFQAPSEARGGGGLIGLYGVLSATDGEFELEHVGSTREITDRIEGPVKAPGWFTRAYGPLSSLDDFRQVNLSPIFPTVAETALRMYESATGVRLDGMIAMDPIVLGKLTRATGPLSAEGWDVQVNGSNVRRLLMHDIYLKFGRWHSKDQNAYLATLVDQLWTRLRSNDLDAAALVTSLGDSVESGRLRLFMRDPSAARSLARLGVDGDPDSAGPNVQMIFHNNWAGNKVDYFLHRSIDTTVTVDEGGAALVRTRVSLENRAKSDSSSLLTRPGMRPDLPIGANLMTLSMLLPKGAQLEDVDVPPGAGGVKRVTEGGHPSVWMHVGLAAGESREVSVTYRLANVLDEEGHIAFTLYPQSTVRPDTFSLRIVPSSGGRLIPLERGTASDDGSVIARGVLKIAKTFRAVPGSD
ncbi:MAG: hypothetical protein QOG54_1497 [Actinomycetota bacterium]|jgi:hypothetical protein|nr:hypothetical protein [Actinomycetota bacterium]